MSPTTTTTAAPAVTYSTAGTVSSPLDLDDVKGEHQSVNVDANGGSKRRVVSPKVKATLTSLTINNSGTLRRINSVVFPIVYSDKFYKDVLAPEMDDINKLIYYGDIPVGAICGRIESKDVPEPTLVILTLAVLAPYRSFGLGRALLSNALSSALHPTTPPPPVPSSTQTNTRSSLVAVPPRKKIDRAMAHVQVGNEAAKRFYEGLGFKEDKVVENYYSKMEPRSAILMVCDDIAAALGETPNGTS